MACYPFITPGQREWEISICPAPEMTEETSPGTGVQGQRGTFSFWCAQKKVFLVSSQDLVTSQGTFISDRIFQICVILLIYTYYSETYSKTESE